MRPSVAHITKPTALRGYTPVIRHTSIPSIHLQHNTRPLHSIAPTFSHREPAFSNTININVDIGINRNYTPHSLSFNTPFIIQQCRSITDYLSLETSRQITQNKINENKKKILSLAKGDKGLSFHTLYVTCVQIFHNFEILDAESALGYIYRAEAIIYSLANDYLRSPFTLETDNDVLIQNFPEPISSHFERPLNNIVAGVKLVLHSKALAYSVLGQEEDAQGAAQRFLDAVLSLAPSDDEVIRAHVKLAHLDILYECKLYHSVISNAVSLISTFPASAWDTQIEEHLNTMLGIAYVETDQYEEGVQCLIQAEKMTEQKIKHSSEHVDYSLQMAKLIEQWFYQGQAYVKMGKGTRGYAKLATVHRCSIDQFSYTQIGFDSLLLVSIYKMLLYKAQQNSRLSELLSNSMHYNSTSQIQFVLQLINVNYLALYYTGDALLRHHGVVQTINISRKQLIYSVEMCQQIVDRYSHTDPPSPPRAHLLYGSYTPYHPDPIFLAFLNSLLSFHFLKEEDLTSAQFRISEAERCISRVHDRERKNQLFRSVSASVHYTQVLYLAAQGEKRAALEQAKVTLERSFACSRSRRDCPWLWQTLEWILVLGKELNEPNLEQYSKSYHRLYIRQERAMLNVAFKDDQDKKSKKK